MRKWGFLDICSKNQISKKYMKKKDKLSMKTILQTGVREINWRIWKSEILSVFGSKTGPT